MRIVCLILMSIIFNGCNSEENEFKKIIKDWQGKILKIPEFPELKIYGRDTTYDKISTKSYKILNYISESQCTRCDLRFYEWRKLKEEIDSFHMNVSLLFIAHIKNYTLLEDHQKINQFNIPIFYDYQGLLDSLNHFPKDKRLYTFLLNQDNQVLLIGNPVGNMKLWKLYKETIKGNKFIEICSRDLNNKMTISGNFVKNN